MTFTGTLNRTAAASNGLPAGCGAADAAPGIGTLRAGAAVGAVAAGVGAGIATLRAWRASRWRRSAFSNGVWEKTLSATRGNLHSRALAALLRWLSRL
ncbi:MAG: hypothetical protein BWX64_01355 [Acidobacteria bacterium ADurb.Bin051]|nr:MAG: hypothetical protein BWX64_01355 [Acidobacteria bacterium ADurb.Bin051]